MRIKVSVSAAGIVEKYSFRNIDDVIRSTYEEVEAIDTTGEKVMVSIDAEKVVSAVVDLGISREVAKAINILVDVNNRIVNG